MATIGKAKAVAEIKGWRFKGVVAWLLWSMIHVMFLITFRAKIFVMLNWVSCGQQTQTSTSSSKSPAKVAEQFLDVERLRRKLLELAKRKLAIRMDKCN